MGAGQGAVCPSVGRAALGREHGEATMADKNLTISIKVVVQGKEEHIAGLHILPPILEAEGVELDVNVPRGIPSQLIAHRH